MASATLVMGNKMWPHHCMNYIQWMPNMIHVVIDSYTCVCMTMFGFNSWLFPAFLEIVLYISQYFCKENKVFKKIFVCKLCAGLGLTYRSVIKCLWWMLEPQTPETSSCWEITCRNFAPTSSLWALQTLTHIHTKTHTHTHTMSLLRTDIRLNTHENKHIKVDYFL